MPRVATCHNGLGSPNQASIKKMSYKLVDRPILWQHSSQMTLLQVKLEEKLGNTLNISIKQTVRVHPSLFALGYGYEETSCLRLLSSWFLFSDGTVNWNKHLPP